MKKKTRYSFKAIWVMLLSCFFTLQVAAQQVNTVSGAVFDNSGEPIIGASVLIKGTSNGTITDLNGKFNLTNVQTNSTVIVSYIGYVTQEISVKGHKLFSVKLVEDSKALDEVVVVGYGVQRKSDLTGSVASVKGSDAIKSTPTSNMAEALQGRLAGVSVISDGDPGKASTIRIRGINSIKGDGGPLVVIDGFIGGNLRNINPSDIQSIEVLKDASATAVYGSRGANGVILVTTKTPKQDKITVDFNAFVNVKTVLDKPDILNAGEFADLANNFKAEYYAGTKGAEPLYDPSQVQAFKDGKAGYSYIDNIFNEPGVAQNYDLSISGKNGKTSFLASLRYENTDGIIKESNYKQYNWRLKVDTEVRKWVSVGLNLWGNYNEKKGPHMGEYNGLLLSAINFAPTVEPKNEDGSYNNKFAVNNGPTYNPMGHIWELDDATKRLSNNLQGYVDFKIIDGLTFRSQLGITFSNRLGTNCSNDMSYGYFSSGSTKASASSDFDFSFLNTNTLNYTKEFNKNNRISLTGVFEQSHSNNYTHTSTAQGLDFPQMFGYDQLSYAELAFAESDRDKASLMSGMFRLNYVFMNRYMLTASIRADGSSRLADKWAYFPSVAIAWDIKQEPFMESVEWMDQFKLRVGYGSVGNQAVANYRIFSKMEAVKNADGTTSYKIARPAARDLKWERNEQINAGLDLSFLNGRITASADYYNKLSKDVLMEVNQAYYTGWPQLLKNAAEIRNTGFEVTLGATVVRSAGWNWHTDVTLAHNKGTFEKIPTATKMQTQAGSYQNKVFRMIEGEKLGTFFGYTNDGVWKTNEVDEIARNNKGEAILNKKGEEQTNRKLYKVVPGQTKYRDVNGDGVYNESDQDIIGCGQPSFNWGWNNTVSYRNFDFSLFIVGFHGFDIYNATRNSRYGTLAGATTDLVTPNPELLNRWTPENENTDVPGFVKVTNDIKEAISSRYVENGSFVKVKSITLGYSLPTAVCAKGNINGLRIYASVQNPFHITNYSGLDPEAAMGTPMTQGVDWGAYPNGRNFLFGLNFSF
ncbi:MAG: TonB-dependent receptor [Bacteroidaceae bacterium]